MARNESSSQAPGVEMPPDGTENEEADQSPHAAEPVRRAKPRQQAKRKVVEREYEENVPQGEDDRSQGDAHQDHPTPEFVDESPLSALAESTLAMAHVSRVGPGTGPGWTGGMFYDFGDGMGPQPVSKGPVGTFQKTKDLFEVVVAEAGGGRYRFVTKGQPPYEETFPNPPLPLPMERQGGGGRPPLPFPNGAAPNGRGGFDRGGQGPFLDEGFQDQGPQPEPWDDPNFNPEEGVEPEAFQQNQLNGWYRGGPYNRLIYYRNGVPSRPPRGSRPPAALINGGGAAGLDTYDPGAYDHSGDDRISRLEKLVEQALQKKEEKSENSATNMMMTMMVKSMEDAKAAREHEFRMAQLRQGEEEKKANARAVAEAEAVKAKAASDLAIAQAKAAADQAIAAENAKAVQANATAAIQNAKEIATIQSQASQQVITAITNANKNNDASLLMKGIELARDAFAPGEKSTAAEVAEAIKDTVPTVATTVRDTVLGAKGYPIPQPGQPVQQNGQYPPQIPMQQPSAPPAGSDAEITFKNLQLVTFLENAWRRNKRPTVALLDDGLMAYGLTEAKHYDEAFKAIQLATPEIVVAKFEQGTKFLGDPPALAQRIPLIRAMANDPNGRAWLQALKDSVNKAVQAAQQPAPPQAQQPAPQAPKPQQPAAPAQPQGKAGVTHIPGQPAIDPTRPEIPNAAPPVTPGTDPYACDPSRPEIKPS